MRTHKLFFVLFSLIILCSCSKSNDANISQDFSGKYQGDVNLKVTAVGAPVSNQPYSMVIDVAKGENSNELKILFGVWLSKATLEGNKFILQETTFDGNIITTGNGEFIGDKMTINYNQKIYTQTNQYSGTLTKF